MGYTLSSTKGGPVFVKSPPQTVVDLNANRAFAELVGNRKAITAAARGLLAGSDRWDGLEVAETDTGLVYEQFGGSFILSRVPGLVRSRIANLVGNNLGSGVTIGTLTIPASPVAVRVVLTLLGSIGFSGTSGDTGVDITVSAGALTRPGNSNTYIVSPQFAPLAGFATIDLSAGVACTITFKMASPSTSYARFMAEARLYPVGEYA